MPTRLLIADDSPTIQKIFERTFPTEEFAITFANNGEEALVKARKDKPDLIIADINMPLKNGFEVCEEVKKDPLLKDIPVLLLTGILDGFDEDESRRVGADGFIVKPFEANAAIRKIRNALAKREEAAKEEEEVLKLEEVVEEPAAAAPPPQEKKEERFMEAFEQPIFKAEEEGLKKVAAKKDLEGALKETMEGLAEKLAAELGHKLREVVKEVLKETLPKLVRQEMERLRKG